MTLTPTPYYQGWWPEAALGVAELRPGDWNIAGPFSDMVVDFLNATAGKQVRQTPCWPRSWPTILSAALYGCISTGMRGPTCIFWANLTLFSLEGYLDMSTEPAWLA